MAAKRHTYEDTPPVVDMSSLIDCSFLLLAYFIATSTLEPQEADLGMTMPTSTQSTSTAQVEVDRMTVEVNSAGHILLNEEVLDTDVNNRDVPLLQDRLRTYVESARLTNSEPMVIIAADDAGKGQRFIDVLNALSKPGIEISRVTITGFSDN